MDRLIARSTTDQPARPPRPDRKLQLTRETLRQIDMRPGTPDTPPGSLTAKCVTFNAHAIRGRNAA